MTLLKTALILMFGYFGIRLLIALICCPDQVKEIQSKNPSVNAKSAVAVTAIISLIVAAVIAYSMN